MKTPLRFAAAILAAAVSVNSSHAQTSSELNTATQTTITLSEMPDLASDANDANLVSDEADEEVDSLASISDSDIPSVLESAVASNQMPAAMALLVRRWADNNPMAAAFWVATRLYNQDSRDEALGQLAIAWANRDLSGAVNWLAFMANDKNHDRLAINVAYEAARSDPVTALRIATALPQSQERDDLIAFAVQQWSDTDDDAVEQWIAAVQDPALRQRLEADAAITLAAHDAATAATRLAEKLDSGAEQDRSAVAVVQRWAQQAPQAAGAWVLQFPDSTARAAALQNLITIWTGEDADAAKQWASGITDPVLRTAAIAAQESLTE
jgi:hypothetical protein